MSIPDIINQQVKASTNREFEKQLCDLLNRRYGVSVQDVNAPISWSETTPLANF
ncbi:MAG: hypothetical protein ACI9Y1_000897 [Lentisphaeria bacterium]|jgi:hypothetical protein